jgi:peptidoglycan-associated lipoprotein
MKQPVLLALVSLALLSVLVGCAAKPAPTPPPAQKSEAAPAKTAEGPKTEAPKSEAAPAEAAKPEAAKPEEMKAEPAQQAAVQATFQVVYFDFDKYDIKPEFRAVIRANATHLKAQPDMKMVIEGHCDERGTTEYNLALGQRRANAVKNALVAEGVKSSNLKVISYGEERPVDPGHDEAAWAKNRRAVVVGQ